MGFIDTFILIKKGTEKIISVLVNERYIYSYENNIINNWDYECGVRIDESLIINQV
tara:strand:+ start:799 stop:966 length:168 start_codon:yes stop_codon:yes gene_type:complete